ncbi:protein-tyrosine phosphatase family protein [Endozoicomonas arenosclerae]|uniref:protein-tyrosine phosphatase family protein n=1 Tax=Endozoicomonas arenosclerae TaxID=1633495 RepID=UPI000782A996|nr:protein-tyrosine phosphatase family protein [Endozoicomonas arenosclerae]
MQIDREGGFFLLVSVANRLVSTSRREMGSSLVKSNDVIEGSEAMDALGKDESRKAGDVSGTSAGQTVDQNPVNALNRSLKSVSPESMFDAQASRDACGALRRNASDLQLTNITDPKCFLVNPAALKPDYLEGDGLDVSLVCQRISEMRKGSSSGVYENGGVIYWQHLKEQQKAIAELGQKLKDSPCDILFTMERGGTLLSAFLQPYIPEEDRVGVVVSTAKDASLCPKVHITKMTDEVVKACRQGYQSIGIVEVSISGTQIHSIIRHLIDTLRKEGLDSVDLRFFILRQGLSVRPRHRKATGEKLMGLEKDYRQITIHMAVTPVLMGEDVDQHLVYGCENQYPINLLLPDGSLWQLRSRLGCRQTLINLLAGEYNDAIEGLYKDRPCSDSITFEVKDSSSIARKVTVPAKKSRSWDEKDCFWYLINHSFEGEPAELKGKEPLLDRFHSVRERMTRLRDWSESKARELHKKYSALPQKQFMRLCQRDLEDVSMHKLRPLITSICYLLYMGRRVDMAAIFRRQRKLVISVLPKVDAQFTDQELAKGLNGHVKESDQASSIDLLGPCEVITQAAFDLIEAPESQHYDSNISNYLKNKCTRWLNDLCACLSADIRCYSGQSELVDKLLRLKSLLASDRLKSREGKQAQKNRATLAELMERLAVCIEVLTPGIEPEQLLEKKAWLNSQLAGKRSSRKANGRKGSLAAKPQEAVSLTGPFAGKVLQLLKCFGKNNDRDFADRLLSSLMAWRAKIIPSMGRSAKTASAFYPLPDTQIKSSNPASQWNANKIFYGDSIPGIAMKGPKSSDMPDVLSMAEQENVGLFLDLINEHDRQMDKGRDRFDWGSLPLSVEVPFGGKYSLEKTSEEKILFKSSLSVKGQGRLPVSATVRSFRMKGPSGERIIRQVSFPDWPDMKPLPVDIMNELQALVAQQRKHCPHQALAVNCLAGLGRTGCFLALEHLYGLAEKGGLSKANLLLMTLQTLIQGKLSRNHPEFVQTVGQTRSVYEAAKACLDDQARQPGTQMTSVSPTELVGNRAPD